MLMGRNPGSPCRTSTNVAKALEIRTNHSTRTIGICSPLKYQINILKLFLENCKSSAYAQTYAFPKLYHFDLLIEPILSLNHS